MKLLTHYISFTSAMQNSKLALSPFLLLFKSLEFSVYLLDNFRLYLPRLMLDSFFLLKQKPSQLFHLLLVVIPKLKNKLVSVADKINEQRYHKYKESKERNDKIQNRSIKGKPFQKRGALWLSHTKKRSAYAK